jgi:hypothetical protein
LPADTADCPVRLPLLKRQQFLLAFIQKLGSGVYQTDLQKLIFLYSDNLKVDYYSFFPYSYGPYSIILANDIKVLIQDNFLTKNYLIAPTRYFSVPISIDVSHIDRLRSDSLMEKVYTLYPFYAINSKILHNFNESIQLNVNNCKDNIAKNIYKFFSIGYEGKSIEQFLRILLLNNIELLCDVRYNPISRKYGFSKTTLKHYTEKIGIHYIHFPELGIKTSLRQSLNTKEDYDNLFSMYRQSLPSKSLVLDKLYKYIDQYSCISFMCFEKDPLYCHRSVLLNYMGEKYHIESEDL